MSDPTGAVERLSDPRDAMINRTEAEWEALEDAIMTVISFAEGQTLAASDVAALHLVDKCHREDDETATDAYNRGYEDGLRERGGDDLVNASRRADDAMIARSTERTMRILAEARAERAEALLNAPEVADFVAGVQREAGHQRARWAADHDAGKAPEDWFWLLGYLGGKALSAAKAGNTEKALHHTISTAAALANWHAALSGADNSMRPGIEPPRQDMEGTPS